MLIFGQVSSNDLFKIFGEKKRCNTEKFYSGPKRNPEITADIFGKHDYLDCI